MLAVEAFAKDPVNARLMTNLTIASQELRDAQVQLNEAIAVINRQRLVQGA